MSDHTENTTVRRVENMFAVGLFMAALAAFGLFVAAVAGGFEGWSVVAAIAAVALLTASVFLYRAGRRRRIAESTVVVYGPDSSTERVEVDTRTGERRPHEG